MLNINKKISHYNHYKGGNTKKYIVIHGTDNVNDTAINNASFFNEGNKGSSAHYFVDDDSIWQSVEDNNCAWSVGDGKGKYGITNMNSINIEMCGTDNGRYSKETVNNTIELTKYLMKKYNIDVDHVVRHYDASRKNCPSQFSPNNWARWWEFKKRLEENINIQKPICTKQTSNSGLVSQHGRCTIAVDKLNIREKPSTSSKVVGTYRKGESVNYDYYVDNEGYRWISWIGASGNRRYMAVRVLATNKKYGNCV